MKGMRISKVKVFPRGAGGEISASPTNYALLLADIKTRIRGAQVRATLSANAELIHLYWDIGQALAERQRREGWGAAVIPRLARNLANDLPEVKGFSERNLKRMVQFAAEYPGLRAIGPTPLAQLPAKTDAGAIRPTALAQRISGSELAAKGQPPRTKSSGSSKMPPLAAQLPGAETRSLAVKNLTIPAALWTAQQLVGHHG